MCWFKLIVILRNEQVMSCTEIDRKKSKFSGVVLLNVKACWHSVAAIPKVNKLYAPSWCWSWHTCITPMLYFCDVYMLRLSQQPLLLKQLPVAAVYHFSLTFLSASQNMWKYVMKPRIRDAGRHTDPFVSLSYTAGTKAWYALDRQLGALPSEIFWNMTSMYIFLCILTAIKSLLLLVVVVVVVVAAAAADDWVYSRFFISLCKSYGWLWDMWGFKSPIFRGLAIDGHAHCWVVVSQDVRRLQCTVKQLNQFCFGILLSCCIVLWVWPNGWHVNEIVLWCRVLLRCDVADGDVVKYCSRES